MKHAWARVVALFRKRGMDAEFEREIDSHLEMAVQDYMDRGVPPDEARRLARVKFGAIEASKDTHRDSRGIVWLESFFYDLRFAARALRREPAFVATVVLMLALAVAVNVTAFRVMDTMLFGGFPLVKHQDRLLFMEEIYKTPGCCVSYVDFEAWREQARSFQAMAFFAPKFISLSEGNGDSRELWVRAISPNTFGMLGVEPVMGRNFSSDDEVPGAAPVVIIGHRYWKTRLGGREDVIGQNIRINGAPTSIIGVLPDGFDFEYRNDIWFPLEQTAELHRRLPNGAMVVGRLADGASEAGARAELEAINARLAQEYPATNRDTRVAVRNSRHFHGGSDGPLIFVWAGAWFVLLIACANLTNLTLARTQGRARELCTRMALGAGRWRVIRQLVLESLIFAALAGFAAWWISAWGTRAWEVATETPYRIVDYRAGIGTVLYLIGVTLCAAGIITLVSVARLWKLDLQGALKGESRGSTVSAKVKRFSAALVAGQMALAIVLMSGAGVLSRSLWKVLGADVGVQEPEKILVGRVALSQEKYPTPESRAALAESLRAQLSVTPGVESAGVSTGRPVDDFEPRPFELESQIGAMHGVPIFASGPDYFRTIGASILAGRDFSNSDGLKTQQVTIVNQRFVETYFPGQNPVGQRFRLYQKYEVAPEWRTIVGVVSNITQNDWTRQHFVPAAYVPFAQAPTSSPWFFAKTRNVSDNTANAIRNEVRQVDANLEILDFATLKESLQENPQLTNYQNLVRQSQIAPLFALIALLIAAMGLYAVVARSVVQRTKEIGVRIALGAASREIRQLVLFEGMTPVVVGLALGLVASLAVNRVFESQLVGVSPYDVPTLTVAPLLLILVALLGCLLPLRQAVRVNPVVALKHD